MIQPKPNYFVQMDYETINYEPIDYEPLEYEPIDYEPIDCEPIDYDETIQDIDEVIDLYKELETEYIDDFDFLDK